MSVEEDKAQVAAGLTEAFLAEAGFEAPGVPVEAVEAEPEVPSNAAPAAPDDQPVAAAPETEDDDVPPAFNPEIPDDIARELAEADLDEQVEQIVAAREPDEYGEYEEDEEALRERIKLQKRNEFLERELAKTKKSAWVDEAKRYFPLSEHALDSIDATSRRGFLKAARAEHERVLPHVTRYLKEARATVDDERYRVRAEEKERAKSAFGDPIVGPDVHTVDAASANTAVQREREKALKIGPSASLVPLFKAMLGFDK